MNIKIYKFLEDSLQQAFKLEKYDNVRESLSLHTLYSGLPWTPARRNKFESHCEETFGFMPRWQGTLGEITQQIDHEYMHWFFSQVWRPQLDLYSYSGWTLVDLINQQDPKNVLDVGCGYNQFKGRIRNLTGIDPYNNCADYMVDVMDFNVKEKFDHILALGSVNFGEWDDVKLHVEKIFDLTEPGGHIYYRGNPGIPHHNGPWVDIFPWDFERIYSIAQEHGVELVTFKKDNNDRLYWVFKKPA
jgi:SAM-dependent methyltransferase